VLGLLAQVLQNLCSASASAPLTPPPVTVRQVVDAFLKYTENTVEPPTFRQARLYLTAFADRFGERAAASLAPTEVEEYSFQPDHLRQSKRTPKWGDGGRSHFLKVVVRAFRYAERSRLIDRNPLTGLKYPPTASRAGDVLITGEEFVRLLEAATPQFRIILRLLWLTGCRPSEVARLTAEDIDLHQNIVRVQQHKTAKKGKRRTIYLCEAAAELLRGLIERHPSGPILSNRLGNRWEWRSWGYAMRATCRRAGLEGKILYGFRHTFATTALEAGVSDAQTAALLGHSGTKTLHQHYSHLGRNKAVLLDALKVLGRSRGPLPPMTDEPPIRPKPPKYCLHRPSGRAYVYLREEGRKTTRYLDRWGTEESLSRYEALLREAGHPEEQVQGAVESARRRTQPDGAKAAL
jgi:integrase